MNSVTCFLRCRVEKGVEVSQLHVLHDLQVRFSGHDLQYGPPHSFGMIWFDIEGPQYWGSQHDNIVFIQGLINEAEAQGLHIGIYTSESQWSPITGNWEGGARFPLWYAHYDGSPSFSDFRYVLRCCQIICSKPLYFRFLLRFLKFVLHVHSCFCCCPVRSLGGRSPPSSSSKEPRPSVAPASTRTGTRKGYPVCRHTRNLAGFMRMALHHPHSASGIPGQASHGSGTGRGSCDGPHFSMNRFGKVDLFFPPRVASSLPCLLSRRFRHACWRQAAAMQLSGSCNISFCCCCC